MKHRRVTTHATQAPDRSTPLISDRSQQLSAAPRKPGEGGG